MMSESVPHELDVWNSNPFQLSVSEVEVYEASPINTVDSNNVVEFMINGFPDRMKFLAEIFLVASIQVVKSDGALYTSAETLQPSLSNGILTSLFKSCNVYFNNVLVSSMNDHYGIMEYIHFALNFSPAAAMSKLTGAGFFPADRLTERFDMMKDSKSVEIMSKLNIANTEKLLIPNVSLGIKLTFQNPDFYINEKTETTGETATTSSSKLVIKDVKLCVKEAKISDNYLLYMEGMLAKNYSANYEWRFGEIVSTTIPANQSSVTVNNLWNGIKPSIVMLAFMKNNQYIGDRSVDSMKFESYGLKSIYFTINNNQYPKMPFTIINSSSEQKFARVFNSLYSSLGSHHENNHVQVERKNFLTDYMFVALDVTSFSTGVSNLNDKLEVVNVGFGATFKEPLTQPLTALMYLYLPRKVEINSARTVHVVY